MTQPRIGQPSTRRSDPTGATKRWLVLMGVVFLASHVPFVITAPTEIDAANYVLAVRDFDVRTHQPHPPGNPVYVALGKVGTPISRRWPPAPVEAGGLAAVEARALAFWTALFGGLAVWPLFSAFRNLEDRDDVAIAAVALTLATPLYWFTAVRPLSDVPGLVAAVATQGLLLAAWREQKRAGRLGVDAGLDTADRRLVVAAALAGLATGLRTQVLSLTIPLFVGVLVARRGTGRWRLVALCGAAFAVSVLAWAVPMVHATGGVSAYLDALRWQVSDDVAGVRILSRYPSLRHIAVALYQTAVSPWATQDAARVVLGLASIGAAALAWWARPALVFLILAFAPYAILHLCFHEISETRYVLPLVPAAAYLAARGLAVLTGRWLAYASSLVVAGLLVITLPAFAAYVRKPTPVFAAVAEISRRLQADPAAAVVAGHQPFRRTLALAAPAGARVLPSPLMRERLRLVEYWRQGGTRPVLFLNDPRRGSLELIDPASRKLVARYRWPFRRERFIGGIRPDLVDLIEIASPPAWFCGEGWHLTPGSLGVAERRGLPDATAYIRRRPEAALLVLGGEHVGAADGEGPADVTVTLDGAPLADWTVAPDAPLFFRVLRLSPGRLEGSRPLAELVVRYAARDAGGWPARIRLTQFELQSTGRTFFVLGHGWHEREYDLRSDREWRWTSDRATIFVHHVGRDLTLHLTGESPLKYFDAAPEVTIRAGDAVLARFSPSADFAEDVIVPAAALDRADGLIVLETTRTFVPAERGGSPDRRRLGLRLFELTIR